MVRVIFVGIPAFLLTACNSSPQTIVDPRVDRCLMEQYSSSFTDSERYRMGRINRNTLPEEPQLTARLEAMLGRCIAGK